MDKEQLKTRTKVFGLRVLKLVRKLPVDISGRAIGNQLIRSATSDGANYRAACRGRSKAELLSKLGVSLEEADESAYWLELIIEDQMQPTRRVEPLRQEADELCAILFSAIDTVRDSG